MAFPAVPAILLLDTVRDYLTFQTPDYKVLSCGEFLKLKTLKKRIPAKPHE